MHVQSSGQRDSYKLTEPQTVLHAELAGILKAVEMPAFPGETERHIYTDSLASLQLLDKTRHMPNVMANHKHGRTLRTILLKASSLQRKDEEVTHIHVYLHKVPAHVGITGNEIADELAKQGCTDPEAATCIEALPDNVPAGIVRNEEGKEVNAKEVTGCIEQVELAEALREDG